MSGTSTTKFTAAATVPNQESWGNYQRFNFSHTFPHIKLQAYSQFVPTVVNTSTINIETRNFRYAGFRFQQLSQSTDTNQFGSFYLQSFVSDGDGTNIFGFDGTNFNIYFPVFMSQALDMGSKKITHLADPVAITDALTLGYAESIINGSAVNLIGDVTGFGTIFGGVPTTLVLTLNQIPVATGTVNMNSQNVINVGNLGIGVSSPTIPLQFPATTANCKICLYQTGANSFQVYGFGVTAGTLKYTVDASSANHVFYCGASSTTSTELFKIAGTGYATVSAGSGTLYSRVPSATWYKTGSSAGTVVAANTWTKAASSSSLNPPNRQFTTSVNRITFTGSDLSANCVGMYSATAVLSPSSGTPKLGLAVYLNGTNILGCQAYVSPTAAGGLYTLTIANTMIDLDPGEYLEIWVLSSTATTITVSEMSLSFIAA
jgi:hypothetical protein